MYVWLAVAAVWAPVDDPSPQSKLYVAIGVESVSVEPDASAVTASGMFPEVGLTASFAAGGKSAPWETLTFCDCVEKLPAVSVTVTVTV